MNRTIYTLHRQIAAVQADLDQLNAMISRRKLALDSLRADRDRLRENLRLLKLCRRTPQDHRVTQADRDAMRREGFAVVDPDLTQQDIDRAQYMRLNQ